MNVTITTRRRLLEALARAPYRYHGALDETEFLGRLFPLEEMPSNDERRRTMLEDYHQHRVRNHDWDDGWVWSDARLNLLNGPDAKLLDFVELMVDPEVRSDSAEVPQLVSLINAQLRHDTLQLVEVGTKDNRPLYRVRHMESAAGVLASAAKELASLGGQVNLHLERILTAQKREDSAAVIGTAKELVETVCKTVLQEFKCEPAGTPDVPKLARSALKLVEVLYEEGEPNAELEGGVKRLVQALANTVGELATLRNLRGTGHGRPALAEDLLPMHAQLAADAAATFARFMVHAVERTKERHRQLESELETLTKAQLVQETLRLKATATLTATTAKLSSAKPKTSNRTLEGFVTMLDQMGRIDAERERRDAQAALNQAELQLGQIVPRREHARAALERGRASLQALQTSTHPPEAAGRKG